MIASTASGVKSLPVMLSFLRLVDDKRVIHSVPDSGVAALEHAGARALATSGRAPPAPAALIVALLIANRALNGLEIERRSIAMYNTDESHMLIIREFAVSDLHFATVYGLRTDLGGCKIPKFSGGGCPQIPL